MGDFECALDRVVVRYGNEIHAFRLCHAIDVVRRGIAFGAVDLAHGPDGRFVRKPGVNVQISSRLFYHGFILPQKYYTIVKVW
jgi:hypothetical protein